MTTQSSPAPRAQVIGAWLLLAAAIGAHGCLTARWMYENGFFARPPSYDAAWYRLSAEYMYEALERRGLRGLLKAGYEYQDSHPPLVVMTGGVVSSLLGRGRADLIGCWTTTMLFGALFAVGAYRLARNFMSPPYASLAAATALSCPVTLQFLRPFEVQLPMTAFVLLGLDALVRSDCGRRLGWSAAAGAYAALATLAKVLAPLYLAGGLFVVAVVAWRRRRECVLPLKGAALFVLAAFAVAGPWFLRNWREVFRYADAVVGEEGRAFYSRALPLLSFERWIYYPRALVNNGFGLPLAALVVAALLHEAARAWRERRSRGTGVVEGRTPTIGPAGATLGLSALVAWPAIAVGQAADQSGYFSAFIPWGTIAVGAAVSRLRSRSVAAVAVVWWIASAAWTSTLAYRPLYADVASAKFGGLEFVPQCDYRVAAAARNRAANAAPEAEPWPAAEFAATTAERVTNRPPRIAHVQAWQDAYLNTAHVRYEARVAGRDVEVVNLDAVATRAGLAGLPLLRRADFVVAPTNHLRHMKPPLDADKLVAELAARGVEARRVATRRVTKQAEYTLVEIVWPAENSVVAVPAATLDAPSFRRASSEFANGWRLLGSRCGVFDGDRVVVTTYWRRRDRGAAPFELAVRTPDGAARWATVTNLAESSPTGGSSDVVAVTTDELRRRDDDASRTRLLLTVRGPNGAPVAAAATEGVTAAADGALVIDVDAAAASRAAASRPK